MFKFTLRALWRDRTYTALNLYRSHRQGKNIVRVLTNWDFGGQRQWTSVAPAGLVPAAQSELPEVQEAVRVWRFGNSTFKVGAKGMCLASGSNPIGSVLGCSRPFRVLNYCKYSPSEHGKKGRNLFLCRKIHDCNAFPYRQCTHGGVQHAF